MINVFISHPTPYNESQAAFLLLIKEELLKYGLNGINLGTNNWNYIKPLKPIKEMMSTCRGAIVVGLERHNSYIGYDKEHSMHKKELIHKYSSSAWIHIEGGMAYQAGLPLLILKEEQVFPEGILDPNNSESYIFDFSLGKNTTILSAEIQQFISSWANQILKTV